MDAAVETETPQWKKDLIARLKNQNKTVATVGSVDQQLYSSPQYSSSRAGHQPILTCKSESVASGVSSLPGVTDQCNVISTCSSNDKAKMVQERVWVDNDHDHFSEMVSENYGNNGYHKDNDSDTEDLHYGPGIVKKLKNKYLSLALRESVSRPSILHMRKAASLENILDDDVPERKSGNRNFQSRLNGDGGRNAPNRYRNAGRQGHEMKRARSVEAISRIDNNFAVSNEVRPNRQSLHEEMLIAEGNDYPHRKVDKLETNTENKFSLTTGYRINRPKRIQPVMNEKEKPPADVVKQAKMIFERRAEQRTKAPPQTGGVAAKVDSFNNIIVKAKVEAKVSKKPPVKGNKPVLNDKFICNTRPVAKHVVVSEERHKEIQPNKNLDFNKVPKNDFKEVPLPNPIPDVSRIDFPSKGETENSSNLTETPDLILTSSPLPMLSSPTHKKNVTEDFIKEEIRNSSPIFDNNRQCSPVPKKLTSPLLSPSRVKPASPLSSPSFNKPSSLSPTIFRPSSLVYGDDDFDSPGYKKISPTSVNNISKEASGTAVYNFTNKTVNQGHLPVANNFSVSNVKTPPTQQLKIEVNGHTEPKIPTSAPKLLLQKTQRPKSPPPPPFVPAKPEKQLTVTEIEKNSINIAKSEGKISPLPNKSSFFADSVEVVNKNVVPKKNRSKEPVSNTAVFNFTNRKDVPDYISNDRSRSPSRPEMPKPGEGGIILLPNAADSFTEEDEEIARSLERPPSPCDVTFINDNILIDGKSSINRRTKQSRLRISFVDGPEIYEYPSENSLMLDDSPLSPAPVQLGHTVPNLGGSSLANYTPKGYAEFQPGVTRTIPQTVPKPDVTEVDSTTELVEESQPFSSGNNADILF